VKARLQQNVSLASWTTLQVGGPARYFLHAASEEDIHDALDFAHKKGLPLFVLGGGSNLLIADAGFPGLVLHVGLKGIAWEESGDLTRVRAAAGEEWDSLVANCVDRHLGGIECLSGIPGNAGGTPVQNVGAYGQETSDVLVCVGAIERTTGRNVVLTKEECGFGYRTSIFNTSHRDRYIVTEITYLLRTGATPQLQYSDLVRHFESHEGPPSIAGVREAVRQIRARKGMLIVEGDPDCRSAGSFFKNPIISEREYTRLAQLATESPPRYPASAGTLKTSAAWLIERAGFCKGFALGPAGISSKHTLAIVNRGGASAADLLRLATQIQRGVEDKFGIRLRPEPVLVGFESTDLP
jgi:UDP-N-acetylmuramate dehydrogenase